MGICADKIEEALGQEDFLEGPVEVELDTYDIAVLERLKSHCNSEAVGLKAYYMLEGAGSIFVVEPKTV